MKEIFLYFSTQTYILFVVTVSLQFNTAYSRSNNKQLRFADNLEDGNRKLKISASASIENDDIAKEDTDPDFDFFKDDSFFTDFKKESSNKAKSKNFTISIPTLPSFNISLIQNLTNIGNIFPTKSPETNSSNGIISSILDPLLSLVGFSQIQSSVYPIIMILVAITTGIFWCAVFVYLYSFFFTGGGKFGGNNRKHLINKNYYDNGYGLPMTSYPSTFSGYGRAITSNLDSSNFTDFALNALELLGDKFLG